MFFIFVISSFESSAALFIVLCGVVWFPVLFRCSFDFYWKINYSINDLDVNINCRSEDKGIPITLILSNYLLGFCRCMLLI